MAEKIEIPELCPTSVEAIRVPERQLLAAVLSRAVRDYCGDERIPRRDALQWLSSNAIGPFSYHWICRELDLDSVYFKKIVMDESKQRDLVSVLA